MNKSRRWPWLTFWRSVLLLLVLGGIYATYVRAAYGLGAATRLSDLFPWGLLIGLNVLCGLSLAVGGFTSAATIHVFNLKRYRPIVPAAVLIAFLGYLLAILSLLFDSGMPTRIWPLAFMWNPHSVLFGVVWYLMLYGAVLALEFAPMVFERFGWRTLPLWLRSIPVPLLALAVGLSTMHLHSMLSPLLMASGKLSPLWYTPLLPVLFFLSAIWACLALLLFLSWHSRRAFGTQPERPLLAGLGRALAILLSFYLVLRFLDLSWRGALALLLQNRYETSLLGLEIAALLLPALLLSQLRTRTDPGWLYTCSVLVIAGFMTNHLNVIITSVEAGLGSYYLPKWTEVTFAYSLIGLGVALFYLATKHLPILVGEKAPRPQAAMAASRI